MQIYKTKQELKPEENDYIFELVSNDFELNQKMDLLVSSYQRLKLDPNGFKYLIKALCEKLDLNPHFPRKGDVNERYDVLIDNPSGGYGIVTEVEIPSTAILDAPRNLLDDIAVLTNRRGVKTDNLIPLVMCWDFPNNRTDYWNVVKDIKDVLSIEIKTCSILALAVLAWTENGFDARSDSYYLIPTKNSLDNVLEILVSYGIDEQKYKGLFYPIK
ncbi:hypothetical protein FJZ39_03835 [Candidatus Saccharibacteria bacterium]|nr:hypothetical protein [Candidatus Saccharibacteria bacterium]